ncbi:MAG: response regulator [Desulfobacteraceae bacterium IS3]|nr:MAG: response regulator [Desulfobacteraceae bacterium IS3]
MRVLLVDDEKELVSTLAERLSFRGIDAKWAVCAADALKLLESEQFDIAVLDVKLPKVGGFELKKKIQEKKPEMKFIFMTGHGSEDDFKAGSAQTGADYYLVKPVKIEALIEKMKEIL